MGVGGGGGGGEEGGDWQDEDDKSWNLLNCDTRRHLSCYFLWRPSTQSTLCIIALFYGKSELGLLKSGDTAEKGQSNRMSCQLLTFRFP